MRVLVLNNIPAPYFDPLFERLARAPGWDLTVCYSSVWNRSAGWKRERADESAAMRTVILDEKHPKLSRLLGSSRAAALSLLGELRRARPDYLIIYGYTLAPQTLAILYAVASSTPFAVIGDANIYADRASGWRRAAKSLWLRWVVRGAAAIIYIGTANRRFWERYGARGERLFAARYAVDNEYFARAAESEREAAREMRRRFGIDGRTVFLYVGRLIARKNVDLLIRAAKEMGGEQIAVVIAGDGEERSRLEALAAGDGRVPVIFAGAVAQADLPRYYAMADALVLPARDEPWGLVINEAMAAGLAIVAHRSCGAAVDLVDEKNGTLLDAFSVEEMVGALRRIARDRGELERMKESSRARIEGWTIEGAARGIEEAVTRTSARDIEARAGAAAED